MNAQPAVHSRAILVDLRVSQWTGRKIDRKAAEQVAQANGIDPRVGTYYKSLIDGSALDPLKKHVGEVRAYHYKMTLPWADTGPRVLSTVAYFDYMNWMNDATTKFEQLYKVFEQDYAYHRQEAQRKLGPLFNDAEYPELNVLASKFSFNLHVTPLPVADDLRIDMAEDEVERLREVVRKQTNAVMQEAVADVYRRALDIVEAYVDRLAEEDTVFRDSLVHNARELVDLMPKLNFTADPQLTELGERMQQALCANEPQALRNNMSARKQTHAAASEIKKELMDFFGARG